MNWLRSYFQFEQHGTNLRREVVAGVTTFVTMAYIVAVNPAILKAVGITAGFVLYPFAKVVAGRWREVKPGLWVLAALSLLFFVFYPYS